MPDETLPTPLLLSIQSAAHKLGVSRSKIYDLIADGELDVVKIGTRALIADEQIVGVVQRRKVRGADHA